MTEQLDVIDCGEELESVRASSITPTYSERLAWARYLAEAARNLDSPPQYEAGNPVHCRGEDLSLPIYWQGRQWAVTPFGIECRDGTYVIASNRLWENEECYGWVRHMAGKTWTDLEDFAEALRIARRWYLGVAKAKHF